MSSVSSQRSEEMITKFQTEQTTRQTESGIPIKNETA